MSDTISTFFWDGRGWARAVPVQLAAAALAEKLRAEREHATLRRPRRRRAAPRQRRSQLRLA